MALVLSQTVTAVGATAPASFLATGGTSPYTYSVVSGGAGGTIDGSTGEYIAPSILNSDPKKAYDTIRAVDSLGAFITTQILVGSPLLLFCDIIQQQLSLPLGRVYLWDQKIPQPTDNDLYVAVSLGPCKPFGNTNRTSEDGLFSEQSVNMAAILEVDIISRGPAARDRKEEVILALESNYARTQQDTNAFYIGKISTNFVNLSPVDGAAIPYRYRISVALQYVSKKTLPISYFNDFTDTIIEDP